MVQVRNILKTRLFFGRMNVKVDQCGIDLNKSRRRRKRAVRKIALTAVFNRLNQRIFRDFSAVDVNIDVFFVFAVNARLPDNDFKRPRGIFVCRLPRYFVKQRWAFGKLHRLNKAFGKADSCRKVEFYIAVGNKTERLLRTGKRFLYKRGFAQSRFACGAF